jgi:uncharacterized protein YbaP (TraB family)
MPISIHFAARAARGAVLAAVMLAAALPVHAAPVWWRVSAGRSDVWLIGTPNLAPKGFDWDSRSVEQRLKGASVLIIEPQAKGGLQMFGDLFGAARALRSDQPLETTLPAPLRQRFQAARSGIGQGPDKYAHWKPTAAGVLLTQDYLRAENLATGEAMQAVRKLARRNGVRELASGSYEGLPVVAAAERLNASGQEACLAASLHDIEQRAARLRMAQDWARGVVRPNPTDPADEACFNAMPQLKTLNDRLMGEEAQAIADALKRPGHAVAVFDLGATVMPGGVLDRLRAHGLTVSAPMP